jgi:hypothetical protein
MQFARRLRDVLFFRDRDENAKLLQGHLNVTPSI